MMMDAAETVAGRERGEGDGGAAATCSGDIPRPRSPCPPTASVYWPRLQVACFQPVGM